MSCNPVSSRLAPRAATPDERAELEQHLTNKDNMEGHNAYHLAIESYAAVWDHFMPDGPGYVGKVMVVIYPGGPECVETFTWDKEGRITPQIIDF